MAGKSYQAVMNENAGSSHKKGPKVLRSIEIEPAENGGHSLTHRFQAPSSGMGYHEPETHVFGAGDGKKMVAHLKEHLKLKDSDEEGE